MREARASYRHVDRKTRAGVRRADRRLTDISSPTPHLTPPTDAERDQSLARGHPRWLFWGQAAALVGVAISLYGLAQNTY